MSQSIILQKGNLWAIIVMTKNDEDTNQEICDGGRDVCGGTAIVIAMVLGCHFGSRSGSEPKHSQSQDEGGHYT